MGRHARSYDRYSAHSDVGFNELNADFSNYGRVFFQLDDAERYLELCRSKRIKAWLYPLREGGGNNQERAGYLVSTPFGLE